MKPNFALNLSHDGIGLAHRTATGWELLGEVSLDAPDLTDQLGDLRRVALQHAPEGMLTKLIIPASQVLYTEIDAPGPRPAQRRKQIAAALEGRTPYAVEDLVFDWSGHGDVVQVAVVARETLAEAESFAEDWGFSPVALISLAPQGSFAGEPWFGPSSVAAVHLPEGARVERDQDSLELMAALAQAAPEPLAAPAVEELLSAPQEPEAPPQPDALAPVEVLLAAAPPDARPTEEMDLPGLEAALSAPLESLPDVEPAPEDEADDLDATLQAALDAPASEEPPPPAAPEAGIGALPEIWESPEEEDAALEPAEEVALDSADDAAADLAPEHTEAPEGLPEPEAEAEEPPAPEEAVQEPEPEVATEPPETGSPEAEEIPAPTFASRRPVLGAAEANLSPATPRSLGGAARLHPVAAPEGKAIFARSGKAGITAPGLALPPEPPAEEHPAQRLGKAAKAGLQRAAAGTVALGGSASKALAQNLRNRKVTRVASAETGTATAPAIDQTAPDKTVFGGRKPRQVGGKPKHMGLVLSGGLAAFLLLVALWSSFIGESDTQAPAPEQVASAPADLAPAPEPATDVPPPPFEPPAESEATTSEPAPAVTAPEPAQPVPEPSVAAVEPVVVPELPALEPLTTAPVAPLPDTQLAALSTANTALPPLAPLAPLGSPEAPLSAPQPQPVAPPAPEPVAAPAPAPEPAPEAPPALEPTPEGTLTPGGFMLYAGRPPVVPRARPEAIVAAASAPYADPALAGKRPKARPASVEAAAAAATAQPAPETPAATPDDGATLAPALSDAERTRLAALRPKARPAAVEAAAKAAAATAEAEQAAAATETTGSSLAVAVSRRPLARPRNFKPAVEEALAAAIAAEPPAPVATAAPAPKASAPAPAVELDEPEPTRAAPKLPTSASVAKQATEKNALALNEINLIGLYGTAKNRRALVRLANGRFVKVAVGDRLDGGKVTAIGESQLTYQKGSRSLTLKLLKGS